MANLDNVAKNILYELLDKDMFSKIKSCTTAKEIWETLILLHEGSNSSDESSSGEYEETDVRKLKLH